MDEWQGYEERSSLVNGRFLHNLSGWTASGAAYSAGDGDEQYGVAVLEAGDSVEQQFAVARARRYTLHVMVKAAGADLTAGQATARVVDDQGNTVLTQGLTGTADTWTENVVTLGLGPGGSYTLRISNVSAAGDVKIDDCWLWWVPLTRAGMAARIDTKLGRLASDRSYSTAASGALTEGDYTYAIDAGLRAAGAVNPETDEADIRYLDANSLDLVLDLIEREMLERLERDYAVEVDLSIGERDEKLSQISKTIGRLTGSAGGVGAGRAGAGGGGKVVTRTLRREAADYEM